MPSPEFVVVVVVRGPNAPADVGRIVNAALTVAGAKDIRIERKDT